MAQFAQIAQFNIGWKEISSAIAARKLWIYQGRFTASDKAEHDIFFKEETTLNKRSNDSQLKYSSEICQDYKYVKIHDWLMDNLFSLTELLLQFLPTNK